MGTARLVFGVLGACVLAVSSLVAQSPQREGRWEVTVQMEMANMPMKMPPMKHVQCITKKEIDDGSAVPRGGPNPNSKNDSCKVSDYKVDGNKVTWKMACAPPQSMTGDGEMTFTGDSYDGIIRMTSERGPMMMKLSGKRLGDCTP